MIKKKKWLAYISGIDLNDIQRYEHPSEKIAKAFTSEANRQKHKVRQDDTLHLLSSSLQMLTKKLSELQEQLIKQKDKK